MAEKREKRKWWEAHPYLGTFIVIATIIVLVKTPVLALIVNFVGTTIFWLLVVLIAFFLIFLFFGSLISPKFMKWFFEGAEYFIVEAIFHKISSRKAKKGS